ncbi:MAG: hypothetical protein AAFO99_15055 [Bacteroidota bacterium]
MVALKILVMLSCGAITYQDLKDRAVLWVIFPITGLLLSLLHWNGSHARLFLFYISVNVVLISLVLLVLFLYTKFVARKKFLNSSFGLGDLLFFYAFALGFPTVTFLTLFAISILFSLMVYLFLKIRSDMDTVPLAGLMGLFLGLVILLSLYPSIPSLYQI